jgi:hypothetical protein
VWQSLDWLQWPAMIVTVLAAWLVASNSKHRRNIGFWIFLASNALWIAWAWQAHAWALIVLQVALAGMNIRGAAKTEQYGK